MSYFHQMSQVEAKEIAPGFASKLLHTETMTLSYVYAEAGAELPLHQHPHEQISHILEGEFEMQVGDERKVCQAGDSILIPGNVQHGGKAHTKCTILDVFHPVREDYRF